MPHADSLTHRIIGLAVAAVMVGCGGGDLTVPSNTGTLQVTTSTSGTDQDANGYSVLIDAGTPQQIEASGTLTLAELSPGNHAVELGDVAPNCSVTGENPRTVNVATGETTAIGFEVSCSSTTGSVTITTSTSGPTSDPDGYRISIDGNDRGPLDVSGAITVDGLVPGSHLVGLSGLAANCQVQGTNLQPVTVRTGADASVTYTVTCSPPPPISGTLRITTTTSGSDTDPDGYTYALDGGDANPIGVNATAMVVNLEAGAHSVLIAGLAGNCSVQGENPQSVTINGGATTDLAVVISCSATSGNLRVGVTSSGSPTDPDGYAFTIDGGQAQPIGTNDERTVANLSPGSHTVTLSNVAGNCRVDDASKIVTVATGQTASVGFTVTCEVPAPTTGTIHVTTATSGANPDADGYQFAVDRGTAQQIGANESRDIPNLSAGSHSVVLSGVADNCRVDDSSQEVTVTAGATATVAFSITCDATTGTIRVTTTTSGEDQDPDGYSFTVDKGAGQPIGLNDSKDVAGAVGKHKIELSGLASNCKVDHPSQDVTVAPGATATVAFAVTCTALPPTVGTIHVTTQTSGDNPDPDGYTFTIDNGPGQPIGTTDTKDAANVPVGSHTVALSGLAGNCRVDHDTQNVNVPPGGTANAEFKITCESTAPDAARSSMLADPKNIPTGGSSTITVTVRTASNVPVPNTAVNLSSTGTGNTISPSSAVTDANGVATFTFSSTDGGDKTITATAGGVTLNDTEVITVSQRSSTTTITSVSPEPSTAGTSIQVTVHVTGDGGGTPTGTVAIFSAQEVGGCDAAPLDAAGNASCSFVLNQPGPQTIGATYSGDFTFEGSSDPDGAPHVVDPVAPPSP